MHLNGGTKTAAGIGSGQYVTGNWDITTWRSSKTAYATAPGATQSGNGTMYIEKNRQVATCAPDYFGCDYVWGGNGPCGNGFDCSGFQYYLYNFVGYNYGDDTAQGMYNSSTHISAASRLPGDWVFFDWDSSPPECDSIDHTGVYTGSDSMVHASSSAGEVVSQALTAYYDSHGLYGHRYGANERF